MKGFFVWLANVVLAFLSFVGSVFFAFVALMASIAFPLQESVLANIYFATEFAVPALSVVMVSGSFCVLCFLALLYLSDHSLSFGLRPRRR